MGWSCRVAFVSKNGQTVFAPKGIIYSPETRCSAVTWVKLKFWLTRSIVDHWAVTLRCTMGQICWINFHLNFEFWNTIPRYNLNRFRLSNWCLQDNCNQLNLSFFLFHSNVNCKIVLCMWHFVLPTHLKLVMLNVLKQTCYRIFMNSFCGNYCFLNLTLYKLPTFGLVDSLHPLLWNKEMET